jgi:hypothetical protein
MSRSESVWGWVHGMALLSLALSALAFLFLQQWMPALRFALGLFLLSVVLLLSVPVAYQAVFAMTVAVSLWFDATDLYGTVVDLDTVVHFALNGSGSVIMFFALLRVGGPALREGAAETPPWVLVTWVSLLGLAVATLWELYEWVAEQVVPESMRVGYGDTIADLAAGLGGSVVGGLVLASARHRPALSLRPRPRP